MESEIDELMCKIIIVGDSGVGKTTLMNTFCKGTYNPHLPTIGKMKHFTGISIIWAFSVRIAKYYHPTSYLFSHKIRYVMYNIMYT